MDVEVAGRYEEVQNCAGGAADWTLKRREGMRKSKRKPKCDGLDVEVVERHEEVQKGSRSVADWTLK